MRPYFFTLLIIITALVNSCGNNKEKQNPQLYERLFHKEQRSFKSMCQLLAVKYEVNEAHVTTIIEVYLQTYEPSDYYHLKKGKLTEQDKSEIKEKHLQPSPEAIEIISNLSEQTHLNANIVASIMYDYLILKHSEWAPF